MDCPSQYWCQALRVPVTETIYLKVPDSRWPSPASSTMYGIGWIFDDRWPRKHILYITADLNKEKHDGHWTQDKQWLQFTFHFSANTEASFLKKVVEVGPMPPGAAKPKGESKLSPLPESIHHVLDILNLVAVRSRNRSTGAKGLIKHPSVKKCMLPMPTPKISSNSIKMSSIFSIRIMSS